MSLFFFFTKVLKITLELNHFVPNVAVSRCCYQIPAETVISSSFTYQTRTNLITEECVLLIHTTASSSLQSISEAGYATFLDPVGEKNIKLNGNRNEFLLFVFNSPSPRVKL